MYILLFDIDQKLSFLSLYKIDRSSVNETSLALECCYIISFLEWVLKELETEKACSKDFKTRAYLKHTNRRLLSRSLARSLSTKTPRCRCPRWDTAGQVYTSALCEILTAARVIHSCRVLIYFLEASLTKKPVPTWKTSCNWVDFLQMQRLLGFQICKLQCTFNSE